MEDSIGLPEKEYLYINESQIKSAGQGLFTAIDIYKSELICHYGGKILDYEEANKIADRGAHQYFINLPDKKILDSQNSRCFAKFANDAQGKVRSKFKNNARIQLDENDKVCLIAIRNIKQGEEIFCAYGNKYWSDK